MKRPDELWDEIGEIPEEELMHVLIKLFSFYESQYKQDPGNEEAGKFFQHLDNAISQSIGCNLNRR